MSFLTGPDFHNIKLIKAIKEDIKNWISQYNFTVDENILIDYNFLQIIESS